MNANAKNVLEVEIFDRIYRLKSDKDPEYLERLTQFLDEKMREVAETAPTVDGQKIAVLAALNIVDELFQNRNHEEGDSNKSEEKMSKMLKKLQGVVGEKP